MRPFLLKPAIKDYIWGGTRLRDEFGKVSDTQRLAESWELSCHPDGESIIASGRFKGMKLSEFLHQHPEAMGENFRNSDRFPVLVKLIDAKENLSIQVHPDDDYARIHENDSGKTELWYIIEADDGSELVYGFREKLTKEEFCQAIKDNTLMDKVKRVPVKKDDVFLIKPGTIHAIGKGILLAEIQQNSNVTYRVYDYGRLDKDGNPRELHIKKALEVADTEPSEMFEKGNVIAKKDGSIRLLCDCEYFSAGLLKVNGEWSFDQEEDGFFHLLAIDGEGEAEIDGEHFELKKGTSIFVPAGNCECSIKGNCSLIMTDCII